MKVSYSYYTDTYNGNLIQESSFPKVEQKAERYFDMFTFSRITDDLVDELVKNCICDMAETVYKVDNRVDERVKKSENTDGYSVSYVTEIVDGQDPEQVLRRKLYGIAECYLTNTGLLSFATC